MDYHNYTSNVGKHSIYRLLVKTPKVQTATKFRRLNNMEEIEL